MSGPGTLLGYIVTESFDELCDGVVAVATVAALAPDAPLVFTGEAAARRERDRLAAHAELDADICEPHLYAVAEVRSLP
jgi:hypothetical protein